MFSSKGLFKDIPCPSQAECALPTCWFLHEDATTSANDTAQEYDPFSAGVSDSPPAKRRKIGIDSDLQYGNAVSAVRSVIEVPAELLDAKHHDDPPHTRAISKDATRALADGNKSVASADGRNNLRTVNRAITPPPTQQARTKQNGSSRPQGQQMDDRPVPPKANQHELQSASSEQSSKQNTSNRAVTPPKVKPRSNESNQTRSTNPKSVEMIKKEDLVPRLLGPGPAQHSSRMNFLTALHKQMQMRNTKVVQAGQDLKSLRLTQQELITLALDEEELLARKHDSGIYQNMVRQRAHAISKMTNDQWGAFISDKVARLLRRKRAPAAQPPDSSSDLPHSTGLTAQQHLTVLLQLSRPLVNLQQYGYVTTPPSNEEIASAAAAVKASANWEKCDRCGTRFQVFPGRDEQGRLASGGRCRYHWARAGRGRLSRIQVATGGTEDKHGCCNQAFGSEGCTEADTHVFNVKDRNRLASNWQWVNTPEEDGTQAPVSFDCEMCYTTFGLEVVRVTAVSWPDNKTLLDVLVRPYGEILDLNTRFSGVSKKMYAEAVPYVDQATDPDAHEAETLMKVETPAAARQLLFELLTPTTPLIGHAIDNDLNTLRLIHPTVIDTVLLYPHPRGLPVRNSLRNLVAQHLGRTIQAGPGHDSKEDAVATGDLVTLSVKNKWKILQAEGWKFDKNDELVKEEGASKL
ncbi:uncharacterized protein HMPREF1541_02499 [Cyphellophora europaea CBS 101466]|uniref:Exonuclease domain-containing protein n=1 Tax=Cyphellophora europaea (strain CBS 101466) TaxID=1220924 RepID=W2S411_CYPE1|nr:uncharacterized protein HMPREF1541_02499 [Cyphellophora europaea CBS 101466]ETN43340.1 hypothetical protein HMPREF1541_02499 [Cyphellophora europaea CBS 101466]